MKHILLIATLTVIYTSISHAGSFFFDKEKALNEIHQQVAREAQERQAAEAAQEKERAEREESARLRARAYEAVVENKLTAAKKEKSDTFMKCMTWLSLDRNQPLAGPRETATDRDLLRVQCSSFSTPPSSIYFDIGACHREPTLYVVGLTIDNCSVSSREETYTKICRHSARFMETPRYRNLQFSMCMESVGLKTAPEQPTNASHSEESPARVAQ